MREARLLAACFRLRMDPVALAEARDILAGPLDGEVLIGMAGPARLEPLLHWHALPWPPALGERLRRAYLRSSAKAEAQARIERSLLGALGASGVRTLLLKGASLRREFYPDPALRPMADLDLWVHPADLPKADRAAAGLGLRRRDPDGAWEAMRRFGTEAVYLDPDGLLVEFHWGLHQYERCRGVLDLSPERIWAESRPASGVPSARLLP